MNIRKLSFSIIVSCFVSICYADWDTTTLLSKCVDNNIQVYYQNQSFQGNVNGWFPVTDLTCDKAGSQLQATCSGGNVTVLDDDGKQHQVANAPCKAITTTPYPQAQIVTGNNMNSFGMGLTGEVVNSVVNGANNNPSNNLQYPQTNNQK